MLTPLDISLPNLNAEQRKNVDSIVAAIRESDLRHVVLLSSWGAETPARLTYLDRNPPPSRVDSCSHPNFRARVFVSSRG